MEEELKVFLDEEASRYNLTENDLTNIIYSLKEICRFENISSYQSIIYIKRIYHLFLTSKNNLNRIK